MFEYRVFGSKSGEVTRSWEPVEAANLAAAKTWASAVVVGLCEASQTYSVLIRQGHQAAIVRGELKCWGDQVQGEWSA